MVALPVTGVLGSLISGTIMQYMDQAGGLRGWQWVFLLEGIPAVILGVVALYFLTDRPEVADWLRSQERDCLVSQVGREELPRRKLHGLTFLKAMADRRVWLLILLYFTVAVASNAFGIYLPKLIKSKFPDHSESKIGLLAAIPNLCAMVAMIVNGFHSDHTAERRFHVALPAFLPAYGWAFTAFVGSPALFISSLAL